MLERLAREMPPGVRWTEPEGGFFIWVRLPDRLDIDTLASAARSRGVEISPGPVFYFDGRGMNEMRLSDSFADEDQIRAGVGILAEEARRQLDASS